MMDQQLSGDLLQLLQCYNVNTTHMLPSLHVCTLQSQYRPLAKLFVLSLLEQIGDNSTSQNYTLD